MNSYYVFCSTNQAYSALINNSILCTALTSPSFQDNTFSFQSRDFIYYPENEEKKDKEIEIVCRYPQYFAANSMIKSIMKHMKPTGDGKGGTYFGATGCGKTYTMLL